MEKCRPGKAISIGGGNYSTNNYSMTCMIQTHNQNFLCLAADTWNVTVGEQNTVHKIRANEKNKIIIGCVGHNDMLYPYLSTEMCKILPEKVKTSEFAQFLCNIYDGYNLKKIIYLLESFTRKNLLDMEPAALIPIEDNTISFVIYAYDQLEEKNRFLHIYVNKSVYITSSVEVKETNTSFGEITLPTTCFDVYENWYNSYESDTRFATMKKEELLDWNIQHVQEQIDIDTDKQKYKKRVGSTIDWLIVDNDWNIETNFK